MPALHGIWCSRQPDVAAFFWFYRDGGRIGLLGSGLDFLVVRFKIQAELVNFCCFFRLFYDDRILFEFPRLFYHGMFFPFFLVRRHICKRGIFLKDMYEIKLIKLIRSNIESSVSQSKVRLFERTKYFWVAK